MEFLCRFQLEHPRDGDSRAGEHYPMPALGANMAETRGISIAERCGPRKSLGNSPYLVAGIVFRIAATRPGLRVPGSPAALTTP